MNNFKIKVKQWSSPAKATAGVNRFIEECNETGVKIIDMKTHVTEIEDFMTYVFIFKLQD